MEAQQLADVAAAVADGTPVDWESVESSASTPMEREIVAQLRLLARVGMVARAGLADLSPSDDVGLGSGDTTSGDVASTIEVGAAASPSRWRHLSISEVVGRGGFGIVYRALDSKLDKVVALKLLPAASFRREAEVLGEGRRLARVRHPNVVTIHGADYENGFFGLWMEFVHGRTLRQIVEQRGPFGSDEALLIGVEVARALAAVHAAGVVHRDIKAQNVMREDGGRLVLMDLGAGEDLRGITARRGNAGTPVCMAPEVLNGEPATPQSDIYSLGVLLFFLVTGTHPVSGQTWTAVRAAHQSGRRALLRDLRPDLPAGFVRSVEMLITPSPADRVQTAGAAEALLQQTLVNPPRRWAVWASMAAALTLAVALAASFDTWRGWFGGSPQVRSVAVMPMANLSGDASREYFVDGMTDQLIAELSRLGALRVTDRTSAMSYKGSNKRLADIARELGVEAVLESSLVLAGSDLRLTASLIRADDGERLWSKSYERFVRDAFEVQAEMARDLATSIFGALSLRDEPVPAQAHLPSPEAFDFNLKARSILYNGKREQFREACAIFERATTIDPAYAVAWAGLARCQLGLEVQGLERNNGVAKVTATHALELDPTLAEAHMIVADAKFLGDRDWQGAYESFTEAVRLSPSSSQVRSVFARFLSAAGRTTEAVEQARRGVESDPLAINARQTLALMLYYARAYPDALSHAADTLALNASYPAALIVQARTLAELKRYDEALDTLKRLRAIADSPAALAEVGRISALAGRQQEAVEILGALPAAIGPGGVVQSEDPAFVLLALGRQDQALALLEEAVNQQSSRLLWLRVDPRVDSVRSDPRFEALLSRIGGLD
ncbi:MAG TPA: protein kinase [Vicinamibacterales bacterium]|nr:protein kinase [Vicinamibacterales bacterium]